MIEEFLLSHTSDWVLSLCDMLNSKCQISSSLLSPPVLSKYESID